MSSLTTLLALLAAIQCTFAAPGPNPRAEPLHIPLTRRAAARNRTPADLAVAADHVRSRYGYTPVSARAQRKRANSAGLATTNQDGDSSYFAPISVGTP